MEKGNLRSRDENIIRVLIIEDIEEHANLFREYLEHSKEQRFIVSIANGYNQAIRALGNNQFDVILLDLTLPESQGISTFYNLHARCKGIPIVILSGIDDEMIASEAVRGGAQDYLVKGHADRRLIVRAIRYALERKKAEVTIRRSEERFRSLIENSSDLIALVDNELRFSYASPSHKSVLGYSPIDLLGRRILDFLHPDEIDHVHGEIRKCLEETDSKYGLDFHLRHITGAWITFEGLFSGFEDTNGERRAALNAHEITDRVKKEEGLTLAYEATLEGWSRALELRNKETEGHSKRVTEKTLFLSQMAGVTGEAINYIRWGTLLHDIGKMAIPDSILLKTEELTEDEWDIMRMHPQYAYEMLYPIKYLQPAIDIPYNHHEKWDGSGYPRGLSNEEIPLAARIFAIIDVWDALTSERPYRPAWSEEAAFKYIRDQAGKHFDPDLVEKFIDNFHFFQ
jgi:PAS domain S-box-containing protein/putative nucleotidyltransferase with HDIG domain